MLERVIQIISYQQGIDADEIKGETHLLRDLDMTSMEIMDLCCSIEEEFEIEILDEDLYKIQTVKDISDYVKDKSDDLFVSEK